MRLLTHNYIQSVRYNDEILKIEAEIVKEVVIPFNPDYVRALFGKINWESLICASKAMGYHELPKERPDDSSILADEDFLKKLHHAVYQLQLIEGAMICPRTGRRFPVKEGIPSLISDDDDEQEVPSDENSKAGKRKELASNDIKLGARKKAKDSKDHSCCCQCHVMTAS